MTSNKCFTKQQEFELEMVYKPLYTAKTGSNLTGESITSIRTISNNLYKVFENNMDEVYKFLDMYKDSLIWHDVIKNSLFDCDRLLNFITRYEKYMNKHCWRFISANFCYGIDDVIRKYKNNLYWESVSRYYRFSIDFFIEMKNYINFGIFFVENTSNKQEIYNLIRSKL